MPTRDEVVEALTAQGLTAERLGGEAQWEQAIREAMRSPAEVRATITAGQSPPPDLGMSSVGSLLPMSPEEAEERERRGLAALVARRQYEEPTPDPLHPEDTCEMCGGARVIVRTRDIEHPDFGRPVPCPECTTGPTAEERWRRARVPVEYQGYSFDGFRSAKNREAARVAWEWDGKTNLVFSGDTGRGKTRLAIAAMRREVFDRGGRARYVYVPDLLENIRRRYGEDSALGSAQRYSDSLVAWPLLVLDDLGAERVKTGWVVEQMTSIIERRKQDGRVTVITTNLADTDGIQRHYTVEEDDIGGRRLASRLGPLEYRWVRATGPDMRQFAPPPDVAPRTDDPVT